MDKYMDDPVPRVIGTGSMKTDSLGESVDHHQTTLPAGSQFRTAFLEPRYPIGPRDVPLWEQSDPIPDDIAQSFLHAWTSWNMGREDAALIIRSYNEWVARRRLASKFKHPVLPAWNEARFFYGPDISGRLSDPSYLIIKPKGAGDFFAVIGVENWELLHHTRCEVIDPSQIKWAGWAQLYRALRGTERVRELENG